MASHWVPGREVFKQGSNPAIAKTLTNRWVRATQNLSSLDDPRKPRQVLVGTIGVVKGPVGPDLFEIWFLGDYRVRPKSRHEVLAQRAERANILQVNTEILRWNFDIGTPPGK